MKLTTHKELHDKWMEDPEYRTAYEEETRKEQASEKASSSRAEDSYEEI
ncbi:Predicted transcriptional regulator (fragment) [Xenorhabdus nematophila str. Anatoliense]